MANEEQAKAWNGPDGENWVTHEDTYNQASRYLTPFLYEAAAFAPSERVLDIGCGTGQTTREAARRVPEGRAHGVDISGPMVERSRKRAEEEGLANVTFEQADAQTHTFEPGSFDIAISRFGVMFFDDPAAAFTNIASALKPEGRLALLVWRAFEGNDWVVAIRDALAAGRDLPTPPPDAPGPFGLGDPDRVRAILTKAGFEEPNLTPVDRPMWMGADAPSTFEAMSRLGVVRGLLADLDDQARKQAEERLMGAIEDRATPEGVHFASQAWVINAQRAR